MRSIKLPEKIQTQVMQYLEHCANNPDAQQDIEVFFSFLSPTLKSTILDHLFSKLIKELPIF